MPKKPKRGPVVKTDWIVETSRASWTFDNRNDAEKMFEHVKTYKPAFHERKWRKIQ